MPAVGAFPGEVFRGVGAVREAGRRKGSAVMRSVRVELLSACAQAGENMNDAVHPQD